MLFRSCSRTTGAEYTRKRRLSTKQLNNNGTTDSWGLPGVGAGQKLSSAYRSNSLLAGTSGMHASTQLCMRACASCWLARRRTCVHEGCADMHAKEHACTSLVRTCTPENMRARALCGHARRRTCVHEPCASTHAGEHACTGFARTRTPGNMRARALCGHARQGTCVHEARADVHAYERPCIRPLLTCTLASTRAQRRADLHRLRAGLHCRLLASVLASRLEIRSRISYMFRLFLRRGRIPWKGLSMACSVSTRRVRCRDANSLASLPRSA